MQPNSDTRAKQIEDWCELVLAYYKFNSLYRLDIAEAQNGPVFSNKTTNSILFNNIVSSGNEALVRRESDFAQQVSLNVAL